VGARQANVGRCNNKLLVACLCNPLGCQANGLAIRLASQALVFCNTLQKTTKIGGGVSFCLFSRSSARYKKEGEAKDAENTHDLKPFLLCQAPDFGNGNYFEAACSRTREQVLQLCLKEAFAVPLKLAFSFSLGIRVEK